MYNLAIANDKTTNKLKSNLIKFKGVNIMKNTTNTRKSKRFFSLILSVVLVLGALFVIPVSASAATVTRAYVAYQDPDYGTSGQYVNVANATGVQVKASQVKNLKATNGVKVKVTTSNTSKYAMIMVMPNKNFLGTTKISFKIGNKNYTFNYTFKKYVNPASTFTVDGISKVSDLNQHLMAHVGTLNNGVHRVTIKAKSGWTISHIGARSSRWFLNRDFNTNSFNARIDNFGVMKVVYTNTSNGATITQTIDMLNYSGKQ